ncbi:MAG TPA: hypothetical protein VGG17_00530 [Acidimicrobiales bacterium]
MNAARIADIPGLKFIAALPKPLSCGAWAVGIWMVVGLVWLFKLRAGQPAAIEAVATVHE